MSSDKSKEKPKSKLVVRNLPAQLTEEQFQSAIEKYLEHVDFWYYVPGKITEKKQINSLGYLNFITQEGLWQFTTEFDGHIFVTPKGKEQRAIVEFATYQRVPKPKKKVDARDGTIDTDPDYLAFLESLNQPQVSLPSAEEQLNQRLAAEKDKPEAIIPPLLVYLKEKKAAKAQKMEQVYIMKREKNAAKRAAAKERAKEEKAAAAAAATVTAEGNPNPNPNNAKKNNKTKDPSNENSKRGGRGGMYRPKATEPGTITIMKEKPAAAPVPSGAAPVAVTEAVPEASSGQPSNRGGHNQRGGYGRGRGGGNKQQRYAPKQQSYIPKQGTSTNETE